MEVILYRDYLITITILLSFSTVIAKETRIAEKNIFEKSISLISEKNKYDSQYARYFADFYHQVRTGRPNLGTIKTLKNLSKKTENFADFSELPFITEKIVTRSKIKDLVESCTELETNSKFNSQISKNVIRYLKKYCLNKFITKVSTKDIDSSKEVKDYFFNSISHYTTGSLSSKFSSLFQATKKNEELYKEINLKIIDQSMKNNQVPSQDILGNLEFNGEFTNFLQGNPHYDIKNKHFFTSEFKRIINSFYRHISDEEFSESYQKLDQAVAFYTQNSKYISSETAWLSFTSAGKKLISYGLYEKAIDVFDNASKIAPDDQQNESLFHKMWVYIVAKDYQKALKVIKSNSLLDKYKDLDSKPQYWIARVYQELGNLNIAKELYARLIADKPLTFYSIMALRQLGGLEEERASKQMLQDVKKDPWPSPFEAISLDKDLISMFRRLNLWASINEDSLLNVELDDIVEYKKDIAFVNRSTASVVTDEQFKREKVRLLAKVLLNNDKFFYTFRLIHQVVDTNFFEFNKEFTEILFPFEYFKEIKNMEKDLDPVLILSLIRQESAFNPNAKSVVGARGLMQLMPATARRFQRGVKAEHLKNPKTNIKIGIKYLKGLLRRYDGNIIYSLAAYNAGEGNMDRWLKQGAIASEDPLINLESIPFKETRQYVKLIYRNMFFYKLLNDEHNPTLGLDESFRITSYSKTLAPASVDEKEKQKSE